MADEEQPDTLAEWLRQRFRPFERRTWAELSEGDRAYWEHEAAAVRRAVARGGFKREEASDAAAPRP